MISLSFNTTKKDHYQKEWIYSLKSWPILLLSSFILIPMSLCLSLFIVNLMLDPETYAKYGALFVTIFFFLLTAFLLFIILVKIENIANGFKKHGTIFMDFSEENVHTKSDLVDVTHQWENFSSVLESKDLILLAYAANNQVVQIIPKRAFETEDQLQTFRSLLTEKGIGKLKTFNKSNRKMLLILVLVLAVLMLFCCLVLFSGTILTALGGPH